MAATIATNTFRKGLKIEIDSDPYIIVDFQHVKPGKGNAFVRTRIRNLLTGKVLERTFKSGETVGVPDFEEKNMQFLYKDEAGFHFMDTGNYEQAAIQGDDLGDSTGFLKEQLTVDVQFYRGKPIGIDLPIFVNLKVVSTEPGMRGDTATGASKPAELETGATIQVPLFVNEGDVLKIDTRTGEYIERIR
jgi:elongation factor P